MNNPSTESSGPQPQSWAIRHRAGVRIALIAVVSLFVSLPVIYIAYLIAESPGAEDLRRVNIPQPSILLASDGTRLAVFGRAQQLPVALKDVSPNVIEALIATEDHRFYRHHGIDIERTISGLFHTLAGRVQGGSTITQQLARNLFPDEIGRQRTLHRKLMEMITAIKIERTFSKDQILETYLNTVPFLFGAVGIEMASR
ncbi:MAG TPA: biosynthetic peptidoglycan transglycosylase, partial [Rhodocyclaceae bacterium]|nr:biosynthetic peptidoglycan transglycosylase [Rhodocyclaceae bacterium]